MADNTRVFIDGALFSGESKLLLLRRRIDSCWELPCGELEFGEEPEYAIARIFGDWTGIEVAPDRPLGAWSVLSENAGVRVHEVHIGFTMTLTGVLTSVDLNSEKHSGFAWVQASELFEKIEAPPLRRACERAFAALVRGRGKK